MDKYFISFLLMMLMNDLVTPQHSVFFVHDIFNIFLKKNKTLLSVFKKKNLLMSHCPAAFILICYEFIDLDLNVTN